MTNMKAKIERSLLKVCVGAVLGCVVFAVLVVQWPSGMNYSDSAEARARIRSGAAARGIVQGMVLWSQLNEGASLSPDSWQQQLIDAEFLDPIDLTSQGADIEPVYFFHAAGRWICWA